jgi:dihydrofolate synthase/folylpolyglutamate synthase
MGTMTQTGLFCDWLDGFLDYERIKNKNDFSLEGMKFLVDRFRHPESSFKSVHVAGSKGKGSVSAMIASILDASGNPSGLYTSPHLSDFTERIGTASGPLAESIYGKACDRIVPLVDSIIPGSIPGGAEPTWFELVTLLGFVSFAEAKLPWAVIETGLGGRLDATNVIMPEASVLTPIELEHTEYLGDTIGKIAGEKAGIIKPGIPVFIAEQSTEARLVLEERAKELNCPVFFMDNAVKSLSAVPSRSGLDISIAFNDIPGGAKFSRAIRAKLRLVSPIQAKNAALAAYVVKYLLPEIDETAIERGLSSAWLPGRFEIVSSEPGLVLDGAHTVRSISLALDTFSSLFPGDAELLFACAADKAVDSFAELFRGLFSRITVTRPGERKQSDIEHARKAFTKVFSAATNTELTVESDYELAIENALKSAERKGVPLLVTGSFYLVSEVKKILSVRNRDQGN